MISNYLLGPATFSRFGDYHPDLPVELIITDSDQAHIDALDDVYRSHCQSPNLDEVMNPLRIRLRYHQGQENRSTLVKGATTDP